ncbi:MAG: hypothetical protein HDS03_08315 [Bacteroides sp.]|nr:hypothetical protein [Bacteroides sp.]
MEGKRVLFISNRNFGIQQMIQQTLEKKGAVVEFFDERPANTFFVKAAIRLNRHLLGFYVNRYHRDIIARNAGKRFDYIFFIRGECFSYKNLQALLASHPEAKSIVYHWDSIANNGNALNLLPLFDAKFTFDRTDSRNLGINFLPLFYYDHYSLLNDGRKEFKHDLLFVGTAHSDRYRIIKEVEARFKSLGKKCYIYFFFQGKLMFYKYYLQHKEARSIKPSEVHYESISNDALLDLYRNSRIIVDVSHPKQTGLTLRCMEALGSARKLITTNRDIVNYDFYDDRNILVIDGHNIEVPIEFINSDYHPVAKEIYEKYSLSSWCDTLFRDWLIEKE